MKKVNIPILSVMFLVIMTIISSCKKDKDESPKEPRLIFKFKFDSTQVRLDNFGKPAAILAGNSGQSPKFHKIGAHYLELTKDSLTPIGKGLILYNGPSTTAGGTNAIDFEKEKQVSEGEEYFSVPLKDITAGNYKWLRVSLSYQNYEVKLRANGFDLTGRLSSFVGYNSYIKSFKPKDSLITLNSNKLQGYWAFETSYNVTQGQAPQTTVPNPIASTSPIPAGSCVVTGRFSPEFTVTGTETNDIDVTISLSINKSFEWNDINGNGIWEPLLGENVVDMGLRGVIPIVSK